MTAAYGYNKGAIKILCDGQSFNYAPNVGEAFPPVLRTLLPSLYRVEPVGLSATTYAQGTTTVAQRVDPRIPIVDRCILIDVAGQSDIIGAAQGGGNLTAAQTMSAMETYWADRRTAGVDLIVAATITPMSSAWLDADGQTQRTTLNASILSSSGPDTVADLAGLAHAADPDNTTYFYDGLHPTATLVAEFAALFKAELAALGLPT